MSENVATAADQHDAIITAIEARDAVSAGQLADDHWALSRGQIELFVMPAALDLPLGAFPQKNSA
jgi:DNA-binding GntR family transcriptional regulator